MIKQIEVDSYTSQDKILGALDIHDVGMSVSPHRTRAQALPTNDTTSNEECQTILGDFEELWAIYQLHEEIIPRD